MLKFKNHLGEVAIGIIIFFGVLSIPSVASVLEVKALIAIKRYLLYGFGGCLLIATRQVIKVGEELGGSVFKTFVTIVDILEAAKGVIKKRSNSNVKK